MLTKTSSAVVTVAIIALLSTVLMTSTSGLLHKEDLDNNTCVCSTDYAPLYRTPSYSGHIVQYLPKLDCVLTAGDMEDVFGVSWYNLEIDDKVLWSTGSYFSKGKNETGVCSLP